MFFIISCSWEQRKLEDIGEIITGTTPPTKDKDNYGGTRLFVSPADIQGNRYVTTTNTTLTDKGYSLGRELRGGTSLFVSIGSTIGKVAQIKDSATSNQQINAVVPYTEMDDDFVFSMLENASDKIKKLSAQQAVPIINKTTFGDIEINHPKKDEQTKIGLLFSDLDNLITLHQCKHNYTPITFSFQKANNSTPSWEQRKFSDVVDIGSGMDYKHLGEGDIPVYGTGGYMLSVDAALSEDKDAIGIGRKGTIDKPYILRAPFWTVDTLFYCIPKDGYDLDFTSCLFQNVDWKKKDESTGVPSLSKVIINNVETAAPSYEEQRKIGDYFKGIDNLITLHQR